MAKQRTWQRKRAEAAAKADAEKVEALKSVLDDDYPDAEDRYDAARLGPDLPDHGRPSAD